MQKSFGERLAYFKAKYKQNVDVVAMENLAEEQIECTFAPSVAADKNKGPRSLAVFLESQKTFIRSRREKIEQIHQEVLTQEQRNVRATPRIDPKSVAIVTERQRKSEQLETTVHERLFVQQSVTTCGKVTNKENNQAALEREKREARDCSLKQATDRHIRKKVAKEIERYFALHSKTGDEVASPEDLCIQSFTSHHG